MPLYEFLCKPCNRNIQEIKAMGDYKHECPGCKKPMSKLISTPAAPIFRGSGFYQTDYKNKE